VSRPVKLAFADNSVVRAKAVYLTLLPSDLVKVKGFESYRTGNKYDKNNFGATKFFISWQDGMPQELYDSFKDPETGEPGVIRLIMDGDR
jgi:hypothetical protein